MEVADDGAGGADPAKGTGLLGLADRLDVRRRAGRPQPGGGGTRIRARLPLAAELEAPANWRRPA